ncbi:hypothetical protein Zmor_006089 [Zophobas morio]|uniref:Uncharacterized protein n=1 Tax=Zophobas morio TaxID=2755281 RepID=A0AA38MN95_9CUCU|nr:hypothetical protein Zmor_006089 [Zophobas morio]
MLGCRICGLQAKIAENWLYSRFDYIFAHRIPVICTDENGILHKKWQHLLDAFSYQLNNTNKDIFGID